MASEQFKNRRKIRKDLQEIAADVKERFQFSDYPKVISDTDSLNEEALTLEIACGPNGYYGEDVVTTLLDHKGFKRFVSKHSANITYTIAKGSRTVGVIFPLNV